jgi:2-(1,2-epoxy-1,2-dihydrophenyl)acetyl-CoA isomerase
MTARDEPVRLEIDGGVGRLELNRPDAANGMDLALATALEAATQQLADRDDLRAVLLTGAGARFCGGGDVRAFADAGEELEARLRAIVTPLHTAVLTLGSLDVPVVAAVQGSAAGAGLSLLAGADLVVAAESAKLVMAYTAIGLTPDGGSTWFLERLVGRQRALDLVLTNRVLSATEAMEWGLVTRVVPDADLRAESDALVARLAAGPTHAFGGAKRLFRSALTATFAEQLDAEAAELTRAGTSRDAREGVAAFVAKRAPEFDGRPPTRA